MSQVSNTCENICLSIMRNHTCQSSRPFRSRQSLLSRNLLFRVLMFVKDTLVHECFGMGLVFTVG